MEVMGFLTLLVVSGIIGCGCQMMRSKAPDTLQPPMTGPVLNWTEDTNDTRIQIKTSDEQLKKWMEENADKFGYTAKTEAAKTAEALAKPETPAPATAKPAPEPNAPATTKPAPATPPATAPTGPVPAPAPTAAALRQLRCTYSSYLL
jgi:hypothetical protein